MFKWLKKLCETLGVYAKVSYSSSSQKTKRITFALTGTNTIRVELNGKVLYEGPTENITPEAKAVVDQTNLMKKELVESMKDMFKDIT